MGPPYQKETEIELLGRVDQVAATLQQDVLAFTIEGGKQAARFQHASKAAEASLEDACFWHKSLAGAFFAFADGLCFVLREAITENANRLALSQKLRRILEPESRVELEKLFPLALRHFARLFNAEVTVDTSTEDFRGFRALTEAREAFTHPKNHAEVCPFTLFPTLIPACEWFFLTWRSTLVACTHASHALGHIPGASAQVPIQRFQFRDAKLKAFASRRVAYDAERKQGDFIEDLKDVIFPLMRDTIRAIEVMRNTNTATAVPATCGLRNLVRVLFSQIEGSVLIAAEFLHRFAGGKPVDRRLLIGSSVEVRDRIVVTLDAFAEHFASHRKIQRMGAGWEAFLPTRSLRNRLTHPHSGRDLIVGPEDLDTVLTLASWWQAEAHPCFVIRGAQ